MGCRFSKSFKLGPARLNLRKRGLGMSVGAKGVRVGGGPRGSYTPRWAYRAPALSHTSYSGTGRSRADRADSAAEAAAAATVFGCLGIAFLVLTEVVLMVAVPSVRVPVAAATGILFALSRWRRGKYPEWQYHNKAKQAIRHAAQFDMIGASCLKPRA